MRVKNLLINRRANAVLAAVAAIAIFALWGLIAVTFLAVTGCDEGINMTRPVVMEPTEPVEPTTNGEVKEPETPVVDPEVSDEVVVDPEETVEEPDDEVSEEVPEDPVPPMEPETPAVDPEDPVELEIPEEPEVPADTTAPTVRLVEWYSDLQQYNPNNPITDDVSPRDTIYTKVVFSELMQRTVADDESALPALSIVIDGVATRYRVQSHRASGPDFQSGDCKPLTNGTGGGTDDYVCKYTIPADTVGTIVLHIGSATADIAGNTLASESEHDAPFMVVGAGPPKPWNGDIFRDFTTIEDLTSVRENARAAFEPYGFSEETTERLVEMKVQHAEAMLRERSGEISTDELVQIARQLLVSGYGISNEYVVTLRAIYVEERPEEKYLLRGVLFESVGIAYLTVKEANPDAEGEEFEELFRQAARDGTISIVDI